MNKEPKVIDAYLTELASAQGLDKRFDLFLNGLKDEFVDLSTLEYRSRTVVEKLALDLSHPVGINCKAIIERAKPQL
ncbi:MAG: hypothetical protein JKY50_04125 [Oleispira sp.]|nr:hypothetical protein [Oleispira sp.]